MMDPNTALAELREHLAELTAATARAEQLAESDSNDAELDALHDVRDQADHLAYHVQTLDEWLSRGGFLPTEWKPTIDLDAEVR